MIQTTKHLAVCALFCCLFMSTRAQDAVPDQPMPESDTAIATRTALQFADSLVKAEYFTEWPTYINLSCSSAIKFYGGKDAFKEHVVTIHYRDEPATESKRPTLKLLHLMNNNADTWQCVVEKLRESWDEQRGKVHTLSYLVGESSDNGLTWRFIDVSHNSLQNVIYILPSIFGTMEIPERKIVYVDEVAAQEAANAAKAVHAPVKKKPVVKKGK